MKKLVLVGLLATVIALPHQVAAQVYGVCATTTGTTEASRVCKATGAVLWSAQITTGASSGFFMVFDTATDPADGSLTSATPLKYCMPVPASSVIGVGPGLSEKYSSGVTFVFSTGANCATKTESATAWFRGVVQ